VEHPHGCGRQIVFGAKRTMCSSPLRTVPTAEEELVYLPVLFRTLNW